jgi:tRNA(Ile)-lysidine synthase
MSEEVKKYIIAVSGGVDSVTLLDMLMTPDRGSRIEDRDNGGLSALRSSIQYPQSQLVVAHVDHGIREESAGDAEFVRELAAKYGLKFEIYKSNLGAKASESTAREVRYKYLRRCCKKHGASAIITAHHQDDLLETAILNILRGTGWRGLSSLRPVSDRQNVKIIRPLLDKTKAQLIDYAKTNQLKWREDHTNINQDYLRNYIRHTLLAEAAKLNKSFNKKMLKIIESVNENRSEIDDELKVISTNFKVDDHKFIIPRYQLTMWPEIVALEVVRWVLTELGPNWHPLAYQINKTLIFAKTVEPNKTLQISKSLRAISKNRHIEFLLTD